MLNTPPFALGATLLFWGWQAGLLPIAIVLAALLEGSRFVTARWEFAQADLDRIWNLCAVLFVGSAVIAFTTGDGATATAGLWRDNSPAKRLEALNKGARSALLIFQWLPVSLFPIIVAQAFHQQKSIGWDTFSWWMRRRRKGVSHPGSAPTGIPTINPSYAYFAACLLATSTTNGQTSWFFPCLAGLLAWVLWSRRPQGFHPTAWAVSFTVAIGLGFLLQLAVIQLQQVLQRLDNALFAHFSGSGTDPKWSHTRIGAIGNLKLSGHIVMEMTVPDGSPPSLLREATYNLFRAPQWTASKKDFTAVTEDTNQFTFVLDPFPRALQAVSLRLRLPGGTGVLALPQGTHRLTDLWSFSVEKNRFGVVRVMAGPSFLNFKAHFNDLSSNEEIPNADDLEILPMETPALRQIVDQLKLQNQPPAEQIHLLHRFFSEHFRYSTWLTAAHLANSNRTALAAFLLETRSGHCEYFATATTLLLRAAGTPARYATGYSVQEKKGDRYVLRDRHAHAWCLAWVNNRWQEVDNTPATWNATEEENARFWEPWADLWTHINFAISEWWWGRSDVKRYLIWLVIPLILILGFQIVFNKRWRRSSSAPRPSAPLSHFPGIDSEFYAIERRLILRGWERGAGESMTAWLKRVAEATDVPAGELTPLLELHNRLRFDPQGLPEPDRLTLRQAATAWLQREGAKPGGSGDPGNRSLRGV